VAKVVGSMAIAKNKNLKDPRNNEKTIMSTTFQKLRQC
jgi:hypothetical protein